MNTKKYGVHLCFNPRLGSLSDVASWQQQKRKQVGYLLELNRRQPLLYLPLWRPTHSPTPAAAALTTPRQTWRHNSAQIQSLLNKDELKHLSGVALHRQQENGGATPSAAAEQQPNQEQHLPLDGCWLPPRFKRVVWVVVDALRYDFAAFSPPHHADGGIENKLHSAG